MEIIAYAVFIMVLATPLLALAAFFGLLLIGFSRILSGIRERSAIDILGVAMIAGSLVAGTFSYQWWRGPKAQLATLQPLIIDRQLAAKLPRTWVFNNGAVFDAFDLLPHGYVDRVLGAHVTSSLLGSVSEGQRDAFMEEIKLIDSPSCRNLIANDVRDAVRQLECAKRAIVSKAEIESRGPYLKISSGTISDTQITTYTLVNGNDTKPIARCEGRAPKETNPLYAMIRRNRALEVAASMYKCKMRAASGGLSHVIATGTIG